MHSDGRVPKAIKEECRARAQRGGGGGASCRKLMVTMPQARGDKIGNVEAPKEGGM